MESCDYCDKSFEAEDEYLKHLDKNHYDELNRIEKRRVDNAMEEEDGGIGFGTVAVLAVIGVGIVVAVYFVFVGGGSESSGSGGSITQPHSLGSRHYHGSLNVTVGGETIDFSQPKYQVRNTGANYFHFENGNGERWHVHGQRVTLRYAMSTLDIGVTDSTVTYDGTTYNASNPGTSISITANGEPVDPSEYVMQRGDSIKIVASRR
ncbi:MAG: hypothetical protein SXQ77_13565 [Halobacteria archaeon]|nr:hypothetical protein [Halobacteria archaeon]